MFEQLKFPYLIRCIPIIGWQGHIYRNLNNNSRTRGRFWWCRHQECSQVSANRYSLEVVGCRYKNSYNSGTVSPIDFKLVQCLPEGVSYVGCTGIGIRVMMMSQHDADGIMELQKWEILSYCYSEASKQHRKILPCVPLQTTCTV